MSTISGASSASFRLRLARSLRQKGQADGNELSSDNVRQQPPFEGGVFGGISNELKSKNPRIFGIFSPDFGSVPGSQLSILINLLCYF